MSTNRIVWWTHEGLPFAWEFLFLRLSLNPCAHQFLGTQIAIILQYIDLVLAPSHYADQQAR